MSTAPTESKPEREYTAAEIDDIIDTSHRPHAGDEPPELETLFSEILGKRPANVDEAISRLYTLERLYADLSIRTNNAADAWADADLIKARIKVQATDKLVAGGMSRTGAEKAASDHEDYTAHRDKLAKLEREKRNAETMRDLVAQMLYNAREVVKMFRVRSAERHVSITLPDHLDGWENSKIWRAVERAFARTTTAPVESDPYETPAKLEPGTVKREKGKRGPKAPSELPPMPEMGSSATVSIQRSQLAEFSVVESAKDYVITGKPVERDEALPTLVYRVVGLIPSRVMAGRWPTGGVVIVSRAAIESADAYVEIGAAHVSGYSELIRIPITARLCFVCRERGGIRIVTGGAVCDECEQNYLSRNVAIGAERSEPVV